MSEEEIIDIIEEILQDPFVYFSQDSSYESVQIRANAIEELLKNYKQQQKEIEELKKPKYLAHFEDNKITKIELINNDFISKDKIREKIKELKQIIEFEKPTYENCLEYTIDILKELLEENNAK